MRLNGKIYTYDEIAALPDGFLADAVLTCGCFDSLHVGHLKHFEFCSRETITPCNVVVCVGSDASVRMLKGPGRPIIPERDRARLVAALECVDAVVVSEESGRMNFVRLMELLKPSVLVVAEDDPARDAKFALCERMGVEMVVDDTRPSAGPSTTGIVNQIMEGVR